jgi:hypothetical protein
MEESSTISSMLTMLDAIAENLQTWTTFGKAKERAIRFISPDQDMDDG